MTNFYLNTKITPIYTLVIFVGLSFMPSAYAGWFWDTGKLKCEMRMNGENCYWEESNPRPDQFEKIETEYYNLYSKANANQESNIDIQLLQHKFMKLVEEMSVIIRKFSTQDPRNSPLADDFSFLLTSLDLTLKLFSQNVQTPDNYWSSRGPRYISAINEDFQKAKCLRTFVNYAKVARAITEKIELTEMGFVKCQFMKKEIP